MELGLTKLEISSPAHLRATLGPMLGSREGRSKNRFKHLELVTSASFLLNFSFLALMGTKKSLRTDSGPPSRPLLVLWWAGGWSNRKIFLHTWRPSHKHPLVQNFSSLAFKCYKKSLQTDSGPPLRPLLVLWWAGGWSDQKVFLHGWRLSHKHPWYEISAF